MRKIIGVLGFVYIISAILLVPMLIHVVWTISFPPAYLDRSTAVFGAFKILFWLVGGLLVLGVLRKHGLSRLNAQVRAIAPRNFRPSFVLIGDYLTEYIGIAREQNKLVAVDLKRSIARCAPIDFIQGWDIEERGLRTSLVIRFNDADMLSIRFDIPRRRRNDIAAALTFATRS